MKTGDCDLDKQGRLVLRTIALASAATGVAVRTLGGWFAMGCPGERGAYCPAAIVEWARTRGPWSQAANDDPLLEGEGGEWLERYRKEKTLAARQERRLKAGELVRVSDALPVLMQFASIIRAAGERVGREYGADAQAVVNEAADEFAAGVRKTLGNDDAG